MHLMAMCLLLSAMAILVTSDSLKVEDCDASLVESMRAEMLQSSAVLSPMYEPGTHIVPDLPVYFLHIPKAAGIQFGTSILLLERTCWNLTRHDIDGLQAGLSAEETHDFDFSQEFEDMCSLADMRRFGYYFRDHSGIGSAYGQYAKGHGLTMLRQPEQRILSAWSNSPLAYHSWPYYIFGRDPEDELEFAKVVAGCSVKMLTRDGASHATGSDLTVCGDPAPATDGETKQAVERLAEGFHYVGILEEWTKSMSLFHAMFGGTCQA